MTDPNRSTPNHDAEAEWTLTDGERLLLGELSPGWVEWGVWSDDIPEALREKVKRIAARNADRRRARGTGMFSEPGAGWAAWIRDQQVKRNAQDGP